jgi:hypothetical protein
MPNIPRQGGRDGHGLLPGSGPRGCERVQRGARSGCMGGSNAGQALNDEIVDRIARVRQRLGCGISQLIVWAAPLVRRRGKIDPATPAPGRLSTQHPICNAPSAGCQRNSRSAVCRRRARAVSPSEPLARSSNRARGIAQRSRGWRQGPVGGRPVRGHQFVEPPAVERQGGLLLEFVPVLVQFFARIGPVDVALCVGDVPVHRSR